MSAANALILGQEEMYLAQRKLAALIADRFPIGSMVVGCDGLGRRCSCVVRFHCQGTNSGYLRCQPVNGSGGRRSMRTFHWSQIEPGVANV